MLSYAFPKNIQFPNKQNYINIVNTNSNFYYFTMIRKYSFNTFV